MGNEVCSYDGGGWTPDSQIDDYRENTPFDEKVTVVGALASSVCKEAEEYEQILLMLATEESILRSGSMNFDEWMINFVKKIRGVAIEVWDYCKN